MVVDQEVSFQPCVDVLYHLELLCQYEEHGYSSTSSSSSPCSSPKERDESVKAIMNHVSITSELAKDSLTTFMWVDARLKLSHLLQVGGRRVKADLLFSEYV